jgi:hypothetical protein
MNCSFSWICSALCGRHYQLPEARHLDRRDLPDTLHAQLVQQILPTRVDADRREALFIIISHMSDMLKRFAFLQCRRQRKISSVLLSSVCLACRRTGAEMADLSILNKLLNLLLFFFSGDLAAAAFSAGFAAATKDQIGISRMSDANKKT